MSLQSHRTRRFAGRRDRAPSRVFMCGHRFSVERHMTGDLASLNDEVSAARFGDLGQPLCWRSPLGQITKRAGLRGHPQRRRGGRLVPRRRAVEVGQRRRRARVARAAPVAGDGIVGIGVADIVRQGLNASVLDEIVINLVPVLLGRGDPNRGWLVNRGEGVWMGRCCLDWGRVAHRRWALQT